MLIGWCNHHPADYQWTVHSSTLIQFCACAVTLPLFFPIPLMFKWLFTLLHSSSVQIESLIKTHSFLHNHHLQINVEIQYAVRATKQSCICTCIWKVCTGLVTSFPICSSWLCIIIWFHLTLNKCEFDSASLNNCESTNRLLQDPLWYWVFALLYQHNRHRFIYPVLDISIEFVFLGHLNQEYVLEMSESQLLLIVQSPVAIMVACPQSLEIEYTILHREK